MTASILVFTLMLMTAAPGVSCNMACSESPSSSEEAESTSGECLMQSTLLKSTVQAEDMEEDGAGDTSDSEVEDEASQDVAHEEDEQYDQVPAEDLPKCKAKEDCKGDGQDCFKGICINGGSLKFKWTLATVDFKCDGGAIGKPIVNGKPDIKKCKDECVSRPGCTGFNRGKKGNFAEKCWFFKTCTSATPKKDLKRNTDFNVYFVSATADVDVPQVTVVKKTMKVLGLTQAGDEQEAAQEDEQEATFGDEQEATQSQEDEQKAAQAQAPAPLKCAAKEDCKAMEGLDCVGGICISGGSLKYKWTLATVDFKCDGGAVGKPIVTGKPTIKQCKDECVSRPGCTGFNRGKKGNWAEKCWFFKTCTSATPKKDLKKNTDYNVYFVSATADVPTVSVTNVKVLG
jgi:hypothetical protein